MDVRVNLTAPIYDGKEVIFKAPCNASEVTGLKLCYQDEVHNFAFADANANNVGHLDNLFAEGAVVKVILDTDTNQAFIQNADTNAYLENRFNEFGGLPTVSDTDAGKFLRVSADGVWEAQTVTNAEEVVF